MPDLFLLRQMLPGLISFGCVQKNSPNAERQEEIQTLVVAKKWRKMFFYFVMKGVDCIEVTLIVEILDQGHLKTTSL